MYFYRSVIGIMAPKRPGTPTGGSEKKRKNNVLTISEKIDLMKKLDGRTSKPLKVGKFHYSARRWSRGCRVWELQPVDTGRTRRLPGDLQYRKCLLNRVLSCARRYEEIYQSFN